MLISYLQVLVRETIKNKEYFAYWMLYFTILGLYQTSVHWYLDNKSI